MKYKMSTAIRKEISDIKTHILSISIIGGFILLLGIAVIVSTFKAPDKDAKYTDNPPVVPPVASPPSPTSPSFSEDLLSSHSTLWKQTYTDKAPDKDTKYTDKTLVSENAIRQELLAWCESLNDPSLGGSGHALDTMYLLSILSKAGSKWEFDHYSLDMPTHAILIGRVPSQVWGMIRYEDKVRLLVDLEMSLQEKTHQMDTVKHDQLQLLPFEIEIRDMYNNKLLAKRKSTFISNRFKFYD